METFLAIEGKASAGSVPASDRAGKSRSALVIQVLGRRPCQEWRLRYHGNETTPYLFHIATFAI